MDEKLALIESQAIKTGIVANLVMALSGWVAFHFSGSQAVLLDGNMSFVLFLSSIVALKISRVKTQKSHNFPFGLYASEALYSFMKGILLLGILVAAFTTNIGRVLQYIEGDSMNVIKTGPIIVYSISMVTICFSLSLFYHLQNKRIKMTSPLLKVDQKGSMIDGLLSGTAGVVLVIIGFIPMGSSFDFLLYIGDALLVCILVLFVFIQPLRVLKEAFIELAAGKLQDEVQHQTIDSKVKGKLKNFEIEAESINISKTGSSYLILIEISINTLKTKKSEHISGLKQQLSEELESDYPYVYVDIILA